MTTFGRTGQEGSGGDGTNTEEGLNVRDFYEEEWEASPGTFRGGEKYAGTERGRLVAEMKLERQERRATRKGSPNRLARFDIGASAKVYGLRALATIVEVMENEGESSAVRLAAAKEVLDRGFGRSKQVTEIGGVDGDEIRNRLVIEFVGVPRKEGVDMTEGGMSRDTTMPNSEVNHKWGQGVREAIEDVVVSTERHSNGAGSAKLDKAWLSGVKGEPKANAE